ncbi:unnamed protein product [Mytilus edulis]|uniref:Uncharacterized protein n=1 Tax=Mytilus edulis TaxID=6550 RepID=A0A8S3QN81_MYTED|nr:unnamed protein product [Mytilus edulis]
MRYSEPNSRHTYLRPPLIKHTMQHDTKVMKKRDCKLKTSIRYKKKPDGTYGKQSKCTINSYRTNNSILVNGSEINIFTENILKPIQEFIQQTQPALDELNRSISKQPLENASVNAYENNRNIDKQNQKQPVKKSSMKNQQNRKFELEQIAYISSLEQRIKNQDKTIDLLKKNMEIMQNNGQPTDNINNINRQPNIEQGNPNRSNIDQMRDELKQLESQMVQFMCLNTSITTQMMIQSQKDPTHSHRGEIHNDNYNQLQHHHAMEQSRIYQELRPSQFRQNDPRWYNSGQNDPRWYGSGQNQQQTDPQGYNSRQNQHQTDPRVYNYGHSQHQTDPRGYISEQLFHQNDQRYNSGHFRHQTDPGEHNSGQIQHQIDPRGDIYGRILHQNDQRRYIYSQINIKWIQEGITLDKSNIKQSQEGITLNNNITKMSQ